MSKGSSRRPQTVSEQEVARLWAQALGTMHTTGPIDTKPKAVKLRKHGTRTQTTRPRKAKRGKPTA